MTCFNIAHSFCHIFCTFSYLLLIFTGIDNQEEISKGFGQLELGMPHISTFFPHQMPMAAASFILQ
jgi:hypothetical protein